MDAFPALRLIDALPLEHEGQPVICLHDPAGYVEEQIVVSPPVFFVAACLDGQRTVRDVQYAFAQQFNGHIISEEQVTRIVGFLDEHGFLQNGRFDALKAAAHQRFADETARTARLAGASYPEQPEALRAYLDDLFRDAGVSLDTEAPGSAPPLQALIVPHIDFPRGAEAYATGYRRLLQGPPPVTAIVFGVAHSSAPEPFVLTRKAFATPFGCVENDTALVERLSDACAWDPFASEYAHRNEHSIEFQAVMLARLYGNAVKIVPILCSSMGDDAQADPDAHAAVQEFLNACHECASEPGVVVIAGADLAHVGRRFGDDFDISDAVIDAVGTRDREDLEHAQACRSALFYRSVMRDGNQRKVCGINAIYAALKCIEGNAVEADLLHYGYAPDPNGGIVSFASIAYVDHEAGAPKRKTN